MFNLKITRIDFKNKEGYEKTKLNSVKRLPKRGHYDFKTINAILDEAITCDVAFVVDGQPIIIPMGFGRKGDTVYLHGSIGSRLLKTIRDGSNICVSATLVDGLVIARSHFHHSLNFRSVVLFGNAREVDSEEEINEALQVIVEHLVPSRWPDARAPNPTELKSTRVIAFKINEASAKVREGGPVDDAKDLDDEVWSKSWAGVVPLKIKQDAPIPDQYCAPNAAPPSYLTNYVRNPQINQ